MVLPESLQRVVDSLWPPLQPALSAAEVEARAIAALDDFSKALCAELLQGVDVEEDNWLQRELDAMLTVGDDDGSSVLAT